MSMVTSTETVWAVVTMYIEPLLADVAGLLCEADPPS